MNATILGLVIQNQSLATRKLARFSKVAITLQSAKKLKLEGYDVIPHLPARTIVNKNDLEKYIGELANESGCSKMLIIGGGGNQAGEISSSIDVLKTDFLSKYNYQFVGVAGHPEGSPDISNENLDLAIKSECLLFP